MKYLLIDDCGTGVFTAEKLRDRIDHGVGKIRIFRLCGTNDPVEMFLRWFGNGYLIVDRFGNNEGV